MAGGSTIAAAIMIKQKRIVAAFRDAGAISPGTAVDPSTLGVHHRMIFKRLRRHAVLREASPGLYYLDEPTWEALRAMRRRFAVVIILLLVVLATVAAVVSWQTALHKH